jgi:hypothetical protein
LPNRSGEGAVPLNRKAAFEFVSTLDDPVLKRILAFGLQVATVPFMHADDLTDEAFARQLPAAPFDLLFYVTVLARVFSNRPWLQALMAGQTDPWEGIPG